MTEQDDTARAPELEELRDELAELREEAAAEDLGGGGAPRPGGQSPAPDDTTERLLSQLLGLAFPILAPAWRVQPAECEILAGAWAPVLDKYAPGLVSSFGIEVQAVAVTLAIIGPRLRMPRKLPEEDGQGSDGARAAVELEGERAGEDG